MTSIPNKADKPSDPPYPGGEDEAPQNQPGAKRAGNPRSNQLPVDESNNGPPTARGDTGEGP
jgi:hypothetical protein